MRRYLTILALLVGCAGAQRDCASCNADAYGADWVVVQVDMAGRPFRCWTLRNTSIDNESQSDGIFWLNPNGNLTHISGLYNRVQVTNGNWDAAYRELGLSRAACDAIAAHTLEADAGR